MLSPMELRPMPVPMVIDGDGSKPAAPVLQGL
jgi:hypothetical protein